MSKSPASPERASLSSETSPKILLVEQPKSARLDSLLAEIEQITESATQATSEDGTGSGSLSGRSAGTISLREELVASLPEASVMQERLQDHIEQETQRLRREARRISRLGQPGRAYHLNELYKQIRQLQLLLATILVASYEHLKRFFVRTFIDHQPIL